MGILEGKIGGVAEAAGTTFAGKMAIAKTAADNFREAVGQGFINAFGALPVPIQTAGLVLQSFAGDLGTIAGPVFQLIGALAQLKMVGGLSGLFGGLSVAVKAFTASMWASVPAVLAAAAPFLVLAAAVGLLIVVWQQLGPQAMETLNMLGQIVGAFAKNIAARMKTAGGDMVRGLWEGFKSGWSTLVSNVQSAVNSLVQYIRDALRMHSPSQVFADQIGAPMAQGVAAGFQQAAPAMTQSIGSSLETVPAQTTRRAQGMGGAGGGGVTVVYSPGFSAASAKEFETLLVPLIDRQLSLNQRRRV